jgi:hypothetical protein
MSWHPSTLCGFYLISLSLWFSCIKNANQQPADSCWKNSLFAVEAGIVAICASAYDQLRSLPTQRSFIMSHHHH